MPMLPGAWGESRPLTEFPWVDGKPDGDCLETHGTW